MLFSCLLLAPGLLVAGSDDPECGERDEQEVQGRVSRCLASATFQFEDARDAATEVVEVREAACLLVAKAVDDCGSVWKECHSGEEVKISCCSPPITITFCFATICGNRRCNDKIKDDTKNERCSD